MIVKRIIIFISLIFVVLLLGVAGYMSIENLNMLDAFYMTVITLSTVGFKEVVELSKGGMLFTIALIGGGITVITVTFAMFTSIILEGEMGDFIKRRKMDKKIKNLKDHIIICGLGQLGEEVVRNLKKTKEKFVVIERSEEKALKLSKEIGEFLYVIDDAEALNSHQAAGIKKASKLITCLGTDSRNLFVVITASEANPALTIVSEAIDQPAREKLRRVGADYVISPTSIGGKRMASVATRPSVVSFLDVITSGGQKEVLCESAEVMETSQLAGKTLKEAQIPKKTGIIVISVKKKNEERFIYNPSSETRIDAGDEIIVMGHQENIRKLKTYTRK